MTGNGARVEGDVHMDSLRRLGICKLVFKSLKVVRRVSTTLEGL